MTFRSPKHQEPESIRIYKKRFWLSRWFFYLLCAGMILCVAALGGAVIYLKPFKEQAASYDLNDIHKLETASVIYDKKGEEIGRIYVENRRPVSFDDIPFHLIQALVATEDSRFFVHEGIDYIGIARAMVRNFMEGSVVQGGSTITQQLARKSFGLTGRSYNRKLVEAFLALRIEKQFSKAEIVELYLNRIYYGGGFYGINAAAQGYFGKPARELSISESATLCGLIKSPNRLSPLRNPDLSRESRNTVFIRMRKEKMISRDQCEELMKLPLVVAPKYADNHSSYVYEEVRQRVIDEIGYEQAARGGFQIFTTIDQRIQNIARESLFKNLARVEREPGYEHQTYADFEALLEALPESEADKKPTPDYLQGALVMIDNHSGAIIAMAGGRDYRHSEFNRALQARRSPGTAFKPFVYATAFANGKFPGSPVNDSPIDNRRVMIGGTQGILGEWGVESAYNFHEGEITARRALVRSKVAATVRLGEETGLENVIALSRRAGIESPMREFNSSFIGSSELLLSELVTAYTIFPNQGTRPNNIYIIESIKDNQGNTVYQTDHSRRKPVTVVDPVSAYQVHSCLAQVLENGTARKAIPAHGLDKRFKGGAKTGTAYNFTDNCFVGYTSEITCGVWAGLDRPRPIHRGAFSNETILPVWVDAMNATFDDFSPVAIEPPAELVKVEICDRSGKLATDGCYENETIDGQNVLARCTYAEYVRPTRKLTGQCPIHGDDAAPNLLTEPTFAFSTSIAVSADIASVAPVSMRGPTVLGDDPYNSVTPLVAVRAAVPYDDEEQSTATVVKPAQVIDTLEIGDDKFRIELPPPPAIEFD